MVMIGAGCYALIDFSNHTHFVGVRAGQARIDTGKPASTRLSAVVIWLSVFVKPFTQNLHQKDATSAPIGFSGRLPEFYDSFLGWRVRLT
jgi:hypothetical protein